MRRSPDPTDIYLENSGYRTVTLSPVPVSLSVNSIISLEHLRTEGVELHRDSYPVPLDQAPSAITRLQL